MQKSVETLEDIVKAPNISANYNMVGSADSINRGLTTASIYDEGSFLVSNLADAFVKSLDKYGLTVEVDHRELGRVVRKEVLA